MKQRLDDKLVKSLPKPEKGAQITWDKDLAGFGLRCTAGGAKSYILNYRAGGRMRRYTIGSVGEWSAAAARKHAAELKARVRLGDDPLAELHERRHAVTVADLCDRFIEDYLPRLREKSRALYTLAIEGTKSRKGIRQALGPIRVDELRHADIERLHRTISRQAPTMANRTHAVLHKMLAQAVKWGMRPDNPATGVEHNQEQKRHRYLTPAEMAALSAALGELGDEQAANVVRLLLLTGCRSGEALAARWEQFDLAAGVWTKPGSTTKQKTTHRVPLSAPALALLSEIEISGPWVFPGKVPGRHRQSIKKPWERICSMAGLVDAEGNKTVRIHDLRHTYASVLASAGLSLPVIGALLGHSQPATTARYAHLMDDPLRQATERAAAVISGAPVAKIVDLRK